MHRFLLAALALAPSVAFASDSTQQPKLQARNIVNSISDEYDFVVVGGGLAGLVLGGRLSEEKSFSVLVLEAGSDGSEFQTQIDSPGLAYYDSLWGTAADWNYHTAPQVNMNNTVMEWPRGKVLGGSSAINGMYLIRPTEIEINAWQDLLDGMDGADNWSWDAMFAAMKKSETFTPPSKAIETMADIQWDASSHGTSGPIHHSYGGYSFPFVGDFMKSAAAAGVPDIKDAYGGQNWGAFVATTAVNPDNYTRSYSKSGYLDPLPHRPNYDVLPNAFATKLVFDSSSPKDNLAATAVQYTMDGGATFQTVKVKKEVILAGGTIGSPTLLMHSGVGPSNVLEAAGVDVLLDLPGVGQNLQDHLSIEIRWNTSQPTGGGIYAAGGAEAENPLFLSYVNDGVGYVGSQTLFGESVVETMKNTIMSSMKDYAPQNVDDTVTAGYEAIYNTVANKIWTSPLGQVELLIGNNVDGAINLGASLQHPLSMGSIIINSNDPMDYPTINPNYLNNPNDAAVLVAALQLCRKIGQSEPLASIMTEVWPGDSVQTDAELDQWMRPNLFTEYHPCSTCAMMPRNKGGVVNANLQVYGLANVRVADASVPPIEISAHLMSNTYGLAEQASNIIRDYWTGKRSTLGANLKTSSANGVSHKSGGEGHNGGHSAAANTRASLLSVFSAVAVAAWFVFGLP